MPRTTHSTGPYDSDFDDPLFDVDECPTAGDGTCDIALNDATCAYDGGDCCASTCQGVNCGPFDCRTSHYPTSNPQKRL